VKIRCEGENRGKLRSLMSGEMGHDAANLLGNCF
jgi:hypothetical protein